jgi:hypothetical protein
MVILQILELCKAYISWFDKIDQNVGYFLQNKEK